MKLEKVHPTMSLLYYSIYVFNADHLELNNQSVCTSLGKTIVPAL